MFRQNIKHLTVRASCLTKPTISSYLREETARSQYYFVSWPARCTRQKCSWHECSAIQWLFSNYRNSLTLYLAFISRRASHNTCPSSLYCTSTAPTHHGKHHLWSVCLEYLTGQSVTVMNPALKAYLLVGYYQQYSTYVHISWQKEENIGEQQRIIKEPIELYSSKDRWSPLSTTRSPRHLNVS